MRAGRSTNLPSAYVHSSSSSTITSCMDTHPTIRPTVPSRSSVGLQSGPFMAGIVIILGAGASSEAGAPLMKDFVNTARDLFQNSGGRISRVFDAMAALARSQAKASLDLQNIEEVFSAFELGSLVQRLGNLEADIIKDLPGAVRELIARTLESRIRLHPGNHHLARNHSGIRPAADSALVVPRIGRELGNHQFRATPARRYRRHPAFRFRSV